MLALIAIASFSLASAPIQDSLAVDSHDRARREGRHRAGPLAGWRARLDRREVGRSFVYELASGRQLAELEPGTGRVCDVECDARGERLLTVHPSETVLWDAKTFAPLQRWKGQKLGMFSCAISADGKLVATGSIGDSAKVEAETETILWDANDGRELARFGGTGFRVDVAFRPDSGALLVSSSGTSEARIFRLDDLKAPARILKGHSAVIVASVWSPDGASVLTASTDFTGRVWSAQKGKELHVLQGHTGYLVACDISADGKQLSTTSWIDRTTRVWNAKTGKLQFVLEGHAERPTCARFAPLGSAFASADASGLGLVFELEHGQLVARLAGHEGIVSGLEFTPDAKWIVTASHDGTVRVWTNPLAK
jgi:WD40 repeat protein